MGTMRNNFAGTFVLLVAMLSTSQSLPWAKENPSRRNSLGDTLTEKTRSTSSSIDTGYECLFVDPKLPICDEEWMQNYRDEETEPSSNGRETKGLNDREMKSLEDNFGEGQGPRLRRCAEGSTKGRVTIYTVEGCMPERLPFSIPSCEEFSLNRNFLDNQIDVQVFRPFTVKGVTRPPYVFPNFDYARWQRMMTQFQLYVASKARNEQHPVADSKAAVPLEEASQGLTDELTQAATTKETMPNGMAVDANVSNGSSHNKLVLDDTKPEESTNKEKEIISDASSSNGESAQNDGRSKAELQTKKTRNRARAKLFHKATVSRNTDEPSDRSRNGDVIVDTVSAIPVTRFHGNRKFYEHQPTLNDPSNQLADSGNSNNPR